MKAQNTSSLGNIYPTRSSAAMKSPISDAPYSRTYIHGISDRSQRRILLPLMSEKQVNLTCCGMRKVAHVVDTKVTNESVPSAESPSSAV
jgi:hypothetical protein